MNELPAVQEIKKFRQTLMRWFNENERKYPWRATNNPFMILIAEMMLQRTKADQVEPVYRKFVKNFRSAYDVAQADISNLQSLLYPLGLRWRIELFKQVSEVVIKDFGGEIPDKRDEILKLPGVGDYVAGIVLSTAFNKKEWIVESNVVRVYKRYFGIATSKEGRRDKHVINISKIYVDCRYPRNANLALLDFAALICTPKKPRHDKCVLSATCKLFLSS